MPYRAIMICYPLPSHRQLPRSTRKYFEAGADIVETNTFSGTSIAMADYHMEDLVYELNFESARIAKKVAKEYTAKDPKNHDLWQEVWALPIKRPACLRM